MSRPDSESLHKKLTELLVDRFEVIDLLGVGGYAAVFRARDLVLGREVAIKAFEADAIGAGAAEAGIDQCLSEARLVATIEHPHIVPLYEVGCESGIVFLVMRIYPDGSLARRLEQGQQLAPNEVVQLGATVADALGTAHDRGVVHLDIKPDNILLDDKGRAAVTDFGIAQAVGATGGENVSSGTPHYMSPEHVSGDILDGRADVYALGVVLYEAASGRTPVSGTTVTQVMANQVRQVPLSLDKIVDKFPTALSKVVDRALAKDPAERWQSVAEMGAALKELIGSDRMLPPSELSKRARRRWYKRGAVGCGLVTIGLLVALSLGVSAWELIASGPRPAVDLMAPAIPEALLDSATTLGLLQEGDTARYVFVPAEGSMADAVVMTSTHLSRIYQGAPRRWELNPDDNYRLNLTNKGGYFIIISADGVHTDTLYHTIRGKEATVLRGALTEVLEGK